MTRVSTCPICGFPFAVEVRRRKCSPDILSLFDAFLEDMIFIPEFSTSFSLETKFISVDTFLYMSVFPFCLAQGEDMSFSDTLPLGTENEIKTESSGNKTGSRPVKGRKPCCSLVLTTCYNILEAGFPYCFAYGAP